MSKQDEEATREDIALEERMIFAIVPATSDSVAMLILGIPAAAWERMKDGHTSTFDLTAAGLPLKTVVYSAATHADCVRFLQDGPGFHMDQDTKDLTKSGVDFGIKDKETKQ